MRYLLPLLVLLLSCETLPPMEGAEFAFERWHHTVSAECHQYLQDAEVTYLTQHDLQTTCKTDILIDGCSFSESNQVFLLRGVDESALAHEYLHILLYCETGSSDHGHVDPSWKGIDRQR